MQRDPSGFVDGPNVYTYAGNNPVTYVDPFGLSRQISNGQSRGGAGGIGGPGGGGWMNWGQGALARGASNYFGQWKSTIQQYAPGWKQGIVRYSNLQSSAQAVNITLGSLKYAEIMNQASAGNINLLQAYGGIAIHTVGTGVKVIGTTLAGTAGTYWGGPWGGVATAAIGGTMVSVVIEIGENKILRFIGIR